MLKKVDVATFETIKTVCEGGDASGVQTFDLSVDGVGYSTSGGFVDDIADQLDAFKEQIISGEIVVPTAP
jgi:basic membrane protein A and related proteins